jgi:hypothetical protein
MQSLIDWIVAGGAVSLIVGFGTVILSLGHNVASEDAPLSPRVALFIGIVMVVIGAASLFGVGVFGVAWALCAPSFHCN